MKVCPGFKGSFMPSVLIFSSVFPTRSSNAVFGQVSRSVINKTHTHLCPSGLRSLASMHPPPLQAAIPISLIGRQAGTLSVSNRKPSKECLCPPSRDIAICLEEDFCPDDCWLLFLQQVPSLRRELKQILKPKVPFKSYRALSVENRPLSIALGSRLMQVPMLHSSFPWDRQCSQSREQHPTSQQPQGGDSPWWVPCPYRRWDLKFWEAMFPFPHPPLNCLRTMVYFEFVPLHQTFQGFILNK